MKLTREFIEEIKNRMGFLNMSGLLYIPGGADTMIYKFRNLDTKEYFILRIFREKLGGRRAEYEFDIQQKLLRRGINVPKPILYENLRSILGHTYLVMEFIEGRTLSERLYTIVNLELYFDLFIRELFVIHQVDLPNNRQPREVEILGDFDEIVNKFSLNELKPLSTWLQLNIPKETSKTLLHGDYHPNNIIVQKNDESKLIVIGQVMDLEILD